MVSVRLREGERASWVRKETAVVTRSLAVAGVFFSGGAANFRRSRCTLKTRTLTDGTREL